MAILRGGGGGGGGGGDKRTKMKSGVCCMFNLKTYNCIFFLL